MLRHVINKLNGSQKCWGQRAQIGEGKLKCSECTMHPPCDCAASKIESAIKTPSHWVGQSSIWVGTDPPWPNHSYVWAYVWECQCMFYFLMCSQVHYAGLCGAWWRLELWDSVLFWMSNVRGSYRKWTKYMLYIYLYVYFLISLLPYIVSITPGSSGYPTLRSCRVETVRSLCACSA